MVHPDFQGIDAEGAGAGLDFFKRGFANDKRTNWLYGLIADSPAYEDLCLEFGTTGSETQYFPRYRSGRT